MHAGTVNRGSGRQVALNNLECVLGKTVSTSAITLAKVCVCLVVYKKAIPDKFCPPLPHSRGQCILKKSGILLSTLLFFPGNPD